MVVVVVAVVVVGDVVVDHSPGWNILALPPGGSDCIFPSSTDDC